MSVAVVVDSDTDLILTKMANAGIQHPTSKSSVFVCGPIKLTVSLGTNGTTPTVHIEPSETHLWPFAAEPTLTFDDRTLHTT